jgi:hypothetical protein
MPSSFGIMMSSKIKVRLLARARGERLLAIDLL